MSVEAFYANWRRYNQLTVEHLRGLTEADLGLRAAGRSEHWPIWAIAAHAAGARRYWLCDVLGEPGAEWTPLPRDSGLGWEDDLSVVRSSAELVEAFESTWRIAAACLERWTPAMLEEAIAVDTGRGVVHHTRQSVLIRLITHEGYHAGEIALIEGMHGRPQLDLWPPSAHSLEGIEAALA